MQVQTSGDIGAGQMGGGIAQVAAASGMQVILSSTNSCAREVCRKKYLTEYFLTKAEENTL